MDFFFSLSIFPLLTNLTNIEDFCKELFCSDVYFGAGVKWCEPYRLILKVSSQAIKLQQRNTKIAIIVWDWVQPTMNKCKVI